MPSTTVNGSTVVFSNSNAAADLSGNVYEVTGVYTIVFDVLAASGGGANTTIYSVDDGDDDPEIPYVQTNKAFATYDTDLLYKDVAVESWSNAVVSWSVDTSHYGAHVWIGTDKKIHYDAGNIIDALGAGETLLDTFVYTIRMSNGTLSVGEISVLLTGSNDGPNITGTEISGAATETDTTLSATGTLNVVDADLSDTVTVSVDSVAVNGSSTFGGTNPLSNAALKAMMAVTPTTPLAADPLSGSDFDWTFTSGSSGNGAFNFLAQGETLVLDYTIKATDSFASTDTQTVTVTITGSNDNATITFNGAQDTAVIEAGGVANGTAGDPSAGGDLDVSDVDDGEAVFQMPAAAALAGTYGNFTFNATTGAWTYTLNNSDPDTEALNGGDAASDSLTVTSFDGTDSEIITVNITGANDNATITFNGAQDSSVIEAGGVANGTAGDPSAGGDLNVSDVDDGEAVFQAPAAAALAGTYGNFTFNAASGAWTYTLNNSDPDTEALNGGDAASDSLTVTSFDGTDSEIITVNITGANDTPVAVNDTAAATEAGGTNNATPGSNGTGNVLTNDTDVDNGATTVVIEVRRGAAEGSGTIGILGAGLAGLYGDLTLNSDGSYTYVVNNSNATVQALNTGATLTDSFNYTVADEHGATDIAVLTVTITGANDAPTITSNGGGASASMFVLENTTGVTDVDSTDPELPPQTLTYSIVGGADALKFSINSSSGELTFKTAPNYEAPTDAGGNNVYNVTVRVSDGSLFDEQAIAVAVVNQNEGPTAGDDVIWVSNSTTVTLPISTLLGNDSDLDGISLSITSITGSVPVTINSNGTFTFTSPAAGGTVAAPNAITLSYTLSDGAGGTDTGSITLNVVATTGGANNVDLTGVAAYQASYIDGKAGADTLTDGGSLSVLIGATGSDELTGNGGNDLLIGGDNNDDLFGGDGNDILRGGIGNNDHMDGGIGLDFLDFSDGSVGMTFTLVQGAAVTPIANGTAGLGNNDTYTNMEGVIGTNFYDTITGSSSDDILRGGGGDDSIDGAGGIDLIDFSDVTGGIGISFALAQGAGSTSFATPGLGTDTYSNMEGVIGTASNDVLAGSNLADTIRAGLGNDAITGGGGGDTLTGGGGADTFIYGAVSDSLPETRDTITDFRASGEMDIIHVTSIDSGDGGAGDFEWGGTTATANGIWYTESAGNTILHFDTNGNTATDEMQIVLTGINLGLVGANFSL
jgi:large repetitive protein